MKPITMPRCAPRVLLTATCLAAAAGAAAQAQGGPPRESTLTVTATILPKCMVVNSTANIAWTIDPSGTAASTGSGGQVRFKCSKGTSFGIKLDGSTANLLVGELSAGNNKLPYTLQRTEPLSNLGLGLGSNKEISVDLSATVAAAEYQDAEPGAYTNTVQVVIEP